MKKIILGLLVIVGILTLTGCNKNKNSIVGSWKHGEYTYTFKEDKTGNYAVGNNKMEFTYEDDGKKVSILYKGNTTASSYEYNIDGNKLIIKDSFGQDVEYTKK